MVLQDERGMIRETHSVSAGLDYPALGPEHAWLAQQGLVDYAWATDEEALGAFETLAKIEGILPALESAHAVAWVLKRAGRWKKRDLVIINLSGRGDKDVTQVAEKMKL
jgi:tryptophan synthase beta chain